MVDQGKIILGGFAAAGVVLLSYIILKTFGPSNKNTKSKKNEEIEEKDDKAEQDKLAGGDVITSKLDIASESEPADQDKVSEANDSDSKAELNKASSKESSDAPNSSKPEVLSPEIDQTGNISKDKLLENLKVSEGDDCDSKADKVQEISAQIVEDTTCTSSFMVVNSLENLQDDNIKELLTSTTNGKKADHSSDESSYDVIEDVAEAVVVSEDEENKNKDEGDEQIGNDRTPAENKTEVDLSTIDEPDKHNETTEDSLNEANEASIVIVEESGSSFYASAEESVSDTKEEKRSDDKSSASSSNPLESGEPESEDTVTGSIADQSAVVHEEQKPSDEVVFVEKETTGEKLDEEVSREKIEEQAAPFVEENVNKEMDENDSLNETIKDNETIASGEIDPISQDQKESKNSGENADVEATSLSNSMSSWLEVNETEKKEKSESNELQEKQDDSAAQLSEEIEPEKKNSITEAVLSTDFTAIEAKKVSESPSSEEMTTEILKKEKSENDELQEKSDDTAAQLSEEIEPEKKNSITEAVLSSDFTAIEANKVSESPSSEEMTTVLSNCQSSPSTTTLRDIDVLASILSRVDRSLQPAALDCLVRVTAFSQHNTALRESGIPQLVSKMTVECCSSWQPGDPDISARLEQVCQVVTNLTLDPATQAQMEVTVPALVGLLCQLCSASAGDRDWLAGWLLRPLTNFSSTQAYTIYFPRLAAPLLGLLESGPPALQLSALRVLVNLSLEPDLLPHFMAARAPENLLMLLELPTGADVTLRVLTFLANLEERLLACPLAPLALPVGEGLATLQVALRGEDSAPQLRSRVFKLTRHADQDVVFQASRLYKAVTAPQPK